MAAELLPLTGTTVVELGASTAMRFCGRMLAAIGASVVAVRQNEDEPEAPAGGTSEDTYLDAGKLRVSVDIDKEGRAATHIMATAAEIVISDRTLDQLHDIGLDVDKDRVEASGRILASITPWGMEGPAVMRKAPELLQFHGGGLGAITPRFANNPTEPPLRLGYPVSEYVAGLSAAVAILAALDHLDRAGIGAVIDVSGQQAIAHAGSLYMAYGPYERRPVSRVSQPGLAPFHFLPCADGYVMIICPEEHQWQGLVELMGDPEWAKSELFASAASRAEYWDAIEPQVVEWLSDKEKNELYHLAQAKRVPIAPVNNVDELLASRQLLERGFFTPLEVDGREVLAPGIPFHSSEPLAIVPSDSGRGRDASGVLASLFAGGYSGPESAGTDDGT